MALWIGHETLSFVATIGIIALMGIEIKTLSCWWIIPIISSEQGMSLKKRS